MNRSKIEWCTHSWNPVSGCRKVSAGCKNCYAEALHHRFEKTLGKFDEIKLHPERISEPLRLKKPANIFVNSLSDTFCEDLNDLDTFDIFTTMNACKWHNFLVLTKRAGQMKDFAKYWCKQDLILDNIWMGVTIENQRAADWRIKLLTETPVSHIWLSIEPMLEPINVDDYLDYDEIDCVIIGCETGKGRRECKSEWIEDIVNKCKINSVPVFVKQINRYGKVIKDMNKFPEVLQIREVPKDLYRNLHNWKPEMEIHERP